MLEFIGASKDKEKLQKIMQNPVYEQLDNETTKMINCYTGANIKINKRKGVSDVCLAIKQMLEEEREKGRQECLIIRQELAEEKKKNKELVERGRIDLMKNLVNKGKLTLDEAAEELGISVEQFENGYCCCS